MHDGKNKWYELHIGYHLKNNCSTIVLIFVLCYYFLKQNKNNTMNALSRKQKEIMDFLLKNQHIFVYPPTLDELCAALGLKSRVSLHRFIQGLI